MHKSGEVWANFVQYSPIIGSLGESLGFKFSIWRSLSKLEHVTTGVETGGQISEFSTPLYIVGHGWAKCLDKFYEISSIPDPLVYFWRVLIGRQSAGVKKDAGR